MDEDCLIEGSLFSWWYINLFGVTVRAFPAVFVPRFGICGWLERELELVLERKIAERCHTP
jgi:hypothetical protein